MRYRVVFDLLDAGYRVWWFPAFGLIFVALGLFGLRFRHLLPLRGPAVFRRLFPWLFFGFSVLWTLSAFIATYAQYWKLASATRSGQVKVVEGSVSEFVPMRYEGHGYERFCVKDDCFEYSDYEVTPGFNNTASHGGPIRTNLPVRVTHVGGAIVRLEVGEP